LKVNEAQVGALTVMPALKSARPMGKWANTHLHMGNVCQIKSHDAVRCTVHTL